MFSLLYHEFKIQSQLTVFTIQIALDYFMEVYIPLDLLSNTLYSAKLHSLRKKSQFDYEYALVIEIECNNLKSGILIMFIRI